MPALVLDRLAKEFATGEGRGLLALSQVSLEVGSSELLVLLGPSGSGKTTLLRIVAGLERASAGTVSIGGKVVNDVPPQDRNVAIVFQDHALYPHLGVYDNLAFGLKLRKFGKKETESRVRETAGLLGLTPLLDRQPNSLSGGERQRVALGRALVLRPEVFLLDEPLSNLDAPLRMQMRREIARLHRQFNGPMIYVTHDQAEAMALADRIAVLDSGVLQQVGPPRELYQEPANLAVARFIGTPAINLLPGRLVQDNGTVYFVAEKPLNESGSSPRLRIKENIRMRIPAAGGVILGLRPEHVRLVKDANASGAAEGCFEAVVESVECLGHESHVWLKAVAVSLVARWPAAALVQVGQRLTVALDAAAACCFDAATGKRLS